MIFQEQRVLNDEDLLPWVHAIQAGLIPKEEAERMIVEGKECPFTLAPEPRPGSILGTTWRHRKTGKVETITPKHLSTRKARRATDALIRQSVQLEDPRSDALVGTSWRHRTTGNVITFEAYELLTFAGRQRAWRIVENAVMLNKDGTEAEVHTTEVQSG